MKHTYIVYYTRILLCLHVHLNMNTNITNYNNYNNYNIFIYTFNIQDPNKKKFRLISNPQSHSIVVIHELYAGSTVKTCMH